MNRAAVVVRLCEFSKFCPIYYNRAGHPNGHPLYSGARKWWLFPHYIA